jgi:hypothetical protein
MPQAFVVLQRCVARDVAILASRVLEDRSNEVERSQCAIRRLRADGSAREYQRSACNKKVVCAHRATSVEWMRCKSTTPGA